jgi:hypothetical protein
MATWCNARLIVAGHGADVTRFRRLVHAQPSVFSPDMLVGETQELFSERAIPLGPELLEKKYFFQVRSDDGLDHFRDLSRSYPALCFVLVYGWDGWNEYSYGSYFIFRGHTRNFSASARLVEKVVAKHGVDDNPDGDWPYEPEVNAERELMDLAEARWQKSLFMQKAMYLFNTL